MKNQLTLTNQQLVSIIEENGITNLIKPLVKEIYLFDTYVAGTNYVDDLSNFKDLKEGDRLVLKREKDNKFDHKAILVNTESQKKLGYIPRKDNAIFSRLLDAGKLLSATVKEINEHGDFYSIKINIYLVDF